MYNKEILLKELSEISGASVKKSVPLARYTTFKIGGPAEFLTIPADMKSLRKIVIYARLNKLPLTVLGGGSNVLIKDKGIKGVVVLFKSLFFKKIEVRGDKILAGAGASLSQVCKEASEAALSGLEPLAGIPGSLGGALAGNAGSRDDSGWTNISDFVESVLVCDGEGEYRILKRKDIIFGYRRSILKDYIIAQVTLSLSRANKQDIKSAMAFYLAKKKKAQEMRLPNAGCIFKNPRDHAKSSGQLIDECGLKGKKINGAQVSHKHANFIVNLGNAKAGLR